MPPVVLMLYGKILPFRMVFSADRIVNDPG